MNWSETERLVLEYHVSGWPVSDVVAYMVAIYGNRKYQDGFADSKKLESGHGQLQQDA